VQAFEVPLPHIAAARCIMPFIAIYYRMLPLVADSCQLLPAYFLKESCSGLLLPLFWSRSGLVQTGGLENFQKDLRMRQKFETWVK